MENPKLRQFKSNITNPLYIKQQISSISNIRYQPLNTSNGIINMGNTCYLSSLLQCLLHSEQLNSVIYNNHIVEILHNRYTDKPNLRCQILLLISYIKIRYLMSVHDGDKLEPQLFKTILSECNPQFCGVQQHDSHELLMTIINSFHEALSYPIEYFIHGNPCTDYDKQLLQSHNDWVSHYNNCTSDILQVCSGQLKTNITCSNCGFTHSKYDPIMCIDLPIINSDNIYTCFDQYTSSEQLDDNNTYACSHCNMSSKAHKKLSLWKLPKMLVIKLNRFSYQCVRGNYSMNKINHKINYPINELNLSAYISNPKLSDYTYKLYAICAHKGGANAGHYYSMIRHDNCEWSLYDDSSVHPIQNENTLVNEDAYILFYDLI